MSETLNIIKNIKKHRKNIDQFEQTIKTFIKEFEMNVNFNIHNNIYDSFITIYQYENVKNGNIFKYLRHFYYYDPSIEENDEEQDLENEDENDIEYKDDIEEEEDENNKNNKKEKKSEAAQRLEIKLILKKNKNKKNNDKKEDKIEKKSEDHDKNNRKENLKNKNKNKEGKSQILNLQKIKVPLLKDIERKINKPKKYIDFNHDITLYYYIANDKNEFVEEYGYENGKLKYYEGNDLEESLDDTFMQHCDELHSIEKLPILLNKNYFNHEFSLLNLFKIENKKEKTGLGNFLKKLWMENKNISIFDSYLNYILNRFLLLDKFMKLNKKEDEDDDIQNILQKKINKELDVDNDFLFYIGKLDLEFGINNKGKFSSFHQVGVFLKIIFIFLTILDKTSCLTDEEEKEEIYQNELRFYDIQDFEKGEFEEVFENIESTLESFFIIDNESENENDSEEKNKLKNNLNLNLILSEKTENIEILQNGFHEVLPEHIKLFFKNDFEQILFGIRMKLWNEYMLEYLNKMYYDKTPNKKSNFIKCYDEFIDEIKLIIQRKYDEKSLESIVMKWEEYKDIYKLYNTIVGNIIKLY